MLNRNRLCHVLPRRRPNAIQNSLCNGHLQYETMMPQEREHLNKNSFNKLGQPQPNDKYDMYFESKEILLVLGQQSNHNPISTRNFNPGKIPVDPRQILVVP